MSEGGSGRLTQEEIDEREELLRKWHEKRNNDPNFIKHRDWVREMFGHDVEALAGFAARMMLSHAAVHNDNEELVRKLNHIYSVAHGLSPDTQIPTHVKRNIARMSLESDPQHPASLAFLSGMNVSKQLQASASAAKRHAANTLARKFVEAEWVLHRTAYKNNKSSFARDYVRRAKNEFGVTITEKQMREVWLKNAPSASSPDGVPAPGQ